MLQFKVCSFSTSWCHDCCSSWHLLKTVLLLSCRGLQSGWSWEAFALAPSWLAQGKRNGHFFASEATKAAAVAESTRVSGSVPAINVTMSSTGTWPGTPWRSNFVVRYTGFMAVRVPGTYRVFLTATQGRSAASCSINGVKTANSNMYTDATNYASTLQLNQGSVVRTSVAKQAVIHCMHHR